MEGVKIKYGNRRDATRFLARFYRVLFRSGSRFVWHFTSPDLNFSSRKTSENVKTDGRTMQRVNHKLAVERRKQHVGTKLPMHIWGLVAVLLSCQGQVPGWQLHRYCTKLSTDFLSSSSPVPTNGCGANQPMICVISFTARLPMTTPPKKAPA
ncbi:hypothetical protein BDN72DRAFT_855272 [Pluteus cervinus]|uniref:Uncharacterized protein n=1 Tax=Pluteus cervinus TaxID=181527 RepID=A0ACD3B4Y5_9AGAR|nr:hypothetical protein BDN72DRAFT_855272 [Pluteus cervinus]